MVLVDTTVWIDLLRGIETPATALLRELLDQGRAAVAPVIVQELLQGAANPQALERLREHFLSLPMLEPDAGAATHARAAELYARCRWRGVTPRSPHDCMIAQQAIDASVPLLHDDRDFELIAGIEARLALMRA